MRIAKILVPLSLALFATTPVWSQSSTGTIKGQVKDFTGAPLPGVTMTIGKVVARGNSDQLQEMKTIETDQDGKFRFMALALGTYTLRAELEGFKTIVRQNLSVRLGGTVTLDLVMNLPELGEEMEIVDTRPTVDREKTSIGENLSHDFIEDLPVLGRRPQSVVEFLPGVVGNGSGNPNVMGQGARSNQWFVDGVNTTDPVTNTFSTNFNFDAIEDIEVVTGAYDAKYGSATGAIINVVTKSGGNNFEGDFSAYYQTSDLVAGQTLLEDSPSNSKNFSALASFGGPIKRDRMWFFISYQYESRISQLTPQFSFDRDYSRYPLQAVNWKSHFLQGKVTWQINDAHKIFASAQTDPTDIRNYDSSLSALPEALGRWRQGGWFATVDWQWTINPNMFLETRAYYQKSFIKRDPMQWMDCQERDEIGRCLDEDLNQPQHASNGGFTYNNFFGYDYDRRVRTSISSDLTASIDNFLGDHTIGAGINYTYSRTKRDFAYIGNAWYIDNVGNDINAIQTYTPSSRYVIINNLHPLQTGSVFNGYLQDVWHPWSNLVIRPGIRVDYTRMNSDYRAGVANFVGVSPRLGLNWDPERDGRTAIRAGYGRFVDTSYLEFSSGENRSGLGLEFYSYDPDEQRYSLSASNSSRPDAGITHTSIVPPREDEFNVGIVRELQRDLQAEVTFIYSSTRYLFEDDEVNLLWNNDGTDVVGYRNGASTTIFRARSAETAFRRYFAAQFVVRKNLSDNFTMNASYVFSRTFTPLPTGLTGGVFSSFLDNAQQLWYETGLPAIDLPHVVKVFGAYDNPNRFKFSEDLAMGFKLGWNFEFASGSPYNRFFYNNWDQANSTLKDQRGTRFRLPATSKLDLRAVLSLDVKGINVDLIVQVFNLFNSRQIVAVYQATEFSDGEPDVDSQGNIRFAIPLARQGTRQFEFGARFKF